MVTQTSWQHLCCHGSTELPLAAAFGILENPSFSEAVSTDPGAPWAQGGLSSPVHVGRAQGEMAWEETNLQWNLNLVTKVTGLWLSEPLSPLWAEGNRHPSEENWANEARAGACKYLFNFLQGKHRLGLSDLNQASLSVQDRELIPEALLHRISLFKRIAGQIYL